MPPVGKHEDEENTAAETATETETAPEAPANEDGQQAQSPWDKNGEEFDPERAATLIQNLRNEVKALKAAAEPEETPTEEAPKEEPEEPAEPEPAPAAPDVEALTKDLAAAKADLAKTQALAAAGLPLDLLPYIPGTTEEEVAVAVEFLLQKFNEQRSQRPGVKPNPAQASNETPEDPKESVARAFFGM